LSCVHTIDKGLSIGGNTLLESTEGFENLRSVGAISIADNENLRVVTGFDRLRETNGVVLSKNPALEAIEFDSLETVTWLNIGDCYGTGGLAHQYALVDLSGLGGLASVQGLYIEGNEALMSADLLDTLVANGASTSPPSVTIRNNHLLSESTVHKQLDTLGVQVRKVCGNAGGDPECICEVD
jgi:hypothetical protein